MPFGATGECGTEIAQSCDQCEKWVSCEEKWVPRKLLFARNSLQDVDLKKKHSLDTCRSVKQANVGQKSHSFVTHTKNGCRVS